MTGARATFVVLLAVAVVTAVAWRPWGDVAGPRPLREAATGIAAVRGVVDVALEGDVTAGWGGAESRYVDVVTRLDETLSPAAAQEAADSAAAALAAESLEGTSLVVDLVIVSGTSGDAALTVRSADGGAVRTAFELVRAGATRVDDGSVVVPDPETLVETARILEARDVGSVQPQSHLSTADGTVVYAAGFAPRSSTAQLLADTVRRPGVTGVGFDWRQAEPSELEVTSAWQQGSAEAVALLEWLESMDESTVVTPTRITLRDPDGDSSTGWVAGLEPHVPEPHPVPLPEGVVPWPDDPQAPACADGDLHLALAGVDAAAGSRYGLITATNASARACTVHTVPDVVPLNAAGEPQADVSTEPYQPGVLPGRLVVPPGESVRAALEWQAMSTANDPDVTTTLRVTPYLGATPVDLGLTGVPGAEGGLDILDGATLRVSPWVQALEGWS